jgi:hypothetical protein
MALTGLVIRWVTRGSAQRFEAASREPLRAQTALLMSMLRRNDDTEYGRRYGFASIRSVADYQKQVPLVTYEDMRAHMERVLAGEKNIFTAEDPVMFAQTSGTTGDSKFIPVTSTCQGQAHKDVSRTWIYHLQKEYRDVYGGKILTLVSPAVEGYAPSGVPFGSTSGDFYKRLPGLLRRTYSVPYEAFEIEDYQAKYYAIMRTALEHDVRLVGTANPSSVLKMGEKANDFAEDIIRDIRDGTLGDRFPIEPQIRTTLESRYRPNADRARELEQHRDHRDGTLKPGDYWPNLRIITCWKGGTVGHYIDKLWPWFDPDERCRIPVRDLGYLSSEFRGSIPLSDEGSKGPLTVASNFFEFVAVDDLSANPKNPSAWEFLTVDRLADGGEYYIFVTTTAGLYRYDINDVIQVAGRYNNTPEIVFLRKGRGMTNITGEKVSVNQVIAACQKAADGAGVVADHFMAEADVQNSRYLFRVEFTTAASEQTYRDFLTGLDRHLKDVNIEYKAKRDSQRLGPPVLHVMREGWYERQRRQQVAGGKRAFQAKTEVLSPIKQHTMEVMPELRSIVELDA